MSEKYTDYCPFVEGKKYLIEGKTYEYTCRCAGWSKEWKSFCFKDEEGKTLMLHHIRDEEKIEEISER